MPLNSEHQLLWEKLSNFVSNICKERDESHGHSHMKKVAENALKIIEADYKDFENYDIILRDTIIVSWLHDVADHKYDVDGRLYQNLLKFLKDESVTDSPELIMNIIDRISYSKEAKAIRMNQPLDWDKVLGPHGIIVRNIVSDADKLEAIGRIGVERCIEYTREHHKEKFNVDIPHDELVKNVIDHANEKLLRLKDHFIRTNEGKRMAEPLHNEMVVLLKELVDRKY